MLACRSGPDRTQAKPSPEPRQSRIWDGQELPVVAVDQARPLSARLFGARDSYRLRAQTQRRPYGRTTIASALGQAWDVRLHRPDGDRPSTASTGPRKPDWPG